MNKSDSTTPAGATTDDANGGIKTNQAANTAPSQHAASPTKKREYEKSGLYPENGKPFRVWALLGVIALTVMILAGISALINLIIV